MILEIAKENRDFILLVSDGASLDVLKDFQRFFPGRYVSFGLSIAHMFSSAAGMAEMGKAPCVVVSADLVHKGLPSLMKNIVKEKMNVKVVVTGKIDLEPFEVIEELKIFYDLSRGLVAEGPCLVVG